MKQKQSIPLSTFQTHPSPQSSPVLNSSPTETETDDEAAGRNDRRRRQHQSPTSSTTDTPTTSSSATINLSREYTLAMQTNSYNEIWAKIHPLDGPETAESSPARLVGRVLQPDRASIREALGAAPPTHLTRLVSHYFDSSETTSALCLSLHRAVDRARKVYAPITNLFDLLPSTSTSLSHPGPLTPAQCDLAFDTFLEFDSLDNPFPAPSAGFHGMRRCFSELRQQLERRARENMAQLDAAARGTYVLNNDLDTIERLVARLHETVESDKKLVRLGLERGRGQRHPIEEVVRQLRKNHPTFLHQLRDLDEHICLFFAAVNRARSLLLQQIHQHQHKSTSVATDS
uniref:UPF0496 protein At3g19330 n=1 Tax=Elaeis guineensis var. tenera TaxID=51953 RepID=A0A6J0PNC5_ELAGV|nr:UPF0496 protein At3g19330 [Elaeis guineensis]